MRILSQADQFAYRVASRPEEAFDPDASRTFRPIDPHGPYSQGPWYHVSPHRLEPGMVLTPRGDQGTNYNYSDSPGQEMRGNWVWMVNKYGVPTWQARTPYLPDKPGEMHVYEVEPHEGPHPWNGTAVDGWVAPSVTVKREVRR